MDAVKFIREEIRMCAESGNCCDCPLYTTIYCSASPKKRSREEAGEIVRRVEAWSAAHPRKTRQSVFLKMFPNVILNDKGQPGFCPKTLDTAYHPGGDCVLDVDICQRCKDKFWMQEVE